MMSTQIPSAQTGPEKRLKLKKTPCFRGLFRIQLLNPNSSYFMKSNVPTGG
jgi:hypothetical protein